MVLVFAAAKYDLGYMGFVGWGGVALAAIYYGLQKKKTERLDSLPADAWNRVKKLAGS